MESVLQAVFTDLAELARTRKPLEIRLLIELLSLGDGEQSTRVLAERMKVSRRHLIAAKHALEADGLITCEEGTRTRPARWRVMCFPQLLVPEVRGAIWAPPPLLPGAHSAPPLEPNGHHPGANSAPPPDETSASCEPRIKEDARASISTVSLRETVFDRLRTGQTPSETVEKWRKLMHSLFAKWESEAIEHGPPDDVIVRKLTALLVKPGDEEKLERLYYEMLAKRWQHPPGSYAYLVVTAAQRLHGIKNEEIRPHLSAAKKPPQKVEAELFRELLAHTRMGYTR